MSIELKYNIYLQTSEVPDKIWAPIPTKLESKTSINQSHTEDHHSDSKGQETGKNYNVFSIRGRSQTS